MRAAVSTVTVRAPAKVNLHLAVGPLRDDGYHDLTTVFQAVGLYDELTVREAEALSLVVQGDTADGVPTDGTNLAVRAVQLLADEAGRQPCVSLLLHKGIPVAGGCAGGSADAAAALVACDVLWGLGLTKDELARLGGALGSDVPFALHGGTALGTGRGEQLTPVLGAGSYAWVLALSGDGLSTPGVYGELDRLRTSGTPALVSDPAQVLAALRRGSPAALGKALANDLQPAAFELRPALRRLLEAGLALGALGAVVSGSGPTVAFLTRDEGHAAALATALPGEGLCEAVRVASGPVPGARVVRSA
ncbi:MAG TPA: 4-(cytidine 5'-diphospho)-2-C-methyl-D-erythritol kinase [Mycobacteriales bacterium]|nr:4-(cytidine 5'-diphospho)-2-C-methyl-D-erythritol kinase [Mycobacteriales bacterium]